MPLSAGESKNSDSAPSGAALMHIEGPRAGQGFALPEPVTSIGRGADNTIVFADDNQVSRRHAEVRAEDGEYVLYDLQSSNGTFVNEERITRHVLSDGDRIRVGQTILLFQAASAEAAVADAAIAAEPAEEAGEAVVAAAGVPAAEEAEAPETAQPGEAGEAIAPPLATGEEQSEEIKQLLAEAERLEQEGNVAEAVTQYREVLTRLPENSPLRREVGLISAALEARSAQPEEGPPPEAQADLEPPPATEAGEEEPDRVNLLLVQAERLEQDGNVAGALSLYQDILAQLPDSNPLRQEVSLIVAALEARQAGRGEAALLVAKGQRLEAQGDVTGALAAYRQALAEAPVGSPLHEELGLVVQDLEGKSRERLAAEEGETQRAEGLEREGRWAEAAAVYREQLATATDPDFVSRCQAGLARCQEEAALAQLFDDGIAASQQGEWARAKDVLTKVVRRRPGYERQGQQAAAWLAEAERQLGPPPDRRQFIWWSVAGGIVVVLVLAVLGGGGYAIIKSSANRSATAMAVAMATVHADETAVAGTQATGTAVVEETATAQIEATGTAVAQQTAAAQATEAVPAEATDEAEGIPPVQPDPPHAFLLLDDDFSDSNSGWDRVEDADQNLDYENGEYVIRVKHESWSAPASGSDEMFSDFTLETDIRLQEGPESATFGLVFRRQDQGNYYRFVIDGAGRYKLEKVQGGSPTSVADTGWTVSPHIQTGKATNHLVVVCFGPKTSLYANGHHLTTVQDETFDAGRVGVVAETPEGSDPIRVVFDNLKVYVPHQAVPPVEPSPAHVFLHTSDDFGDPASGWPITSDSDQAKNYETGEYVILVRQENRSASAFGSLAWFSDFTLETDVRLVEGPSSARAGAVFWHVDDDNYHYFYINGQGQYGVARVQAGKTVGIIEQTPSPHIQSEGVNHLKVVSSGARISFYVNERYLGTVQVDAAGEGRAGLYAQTAEGSDLVKVAFDNVRVYAPDRSPVKPIPPHTELLYSDDFSDPASGWVRMAGEQRERYYENSEYAVMVKQADIRAAQTGINDLFEDITLEADARLAGGPLDGGYGLFFRLRDGDNFYFFVFSGEGQYRVAKEQGGQVFEIVAWTPSPAIHTGSTANHLKVVCFGPEMSFFANDHHLTTVQDDTFDRGKIGVIAVTGPGSGPIKAAFDNLRLYGPGEAEELMPTSQPTTATPRPASSPTMPPPVVEPMRLNKIAFVSDRDGSQEIYVMQADGSSVTRLTNNAAEDSHPAWSPDGTRIAFVSDRDGNHEIYVVNADGSGVTRLTNDPAIDYDPAWSPDSTRIAFEADRDVNIRSDIWLVNADGSNPVKLRDAGVSPSWSPDGDQIAALFRFESLMHLGVMPADGSAEPRPLLTAGMNTSPAWSPDGTRIAFSGAESSADSEIMVINADGSNLVNLTNTPDGVDLRPTWSPDGKQIAFVSDRDGNHEIYVMPAPGTQAQVSADGGGVTRLTNNPAWDSMPSWSP